MVDHHSGANLLGLVKCRQQHKDGLSSDLRTRQHAVITGVSVVTFFAVPSPLAVVSLVWFKEQKLVKQSSFVGFSSSRAKPEQSWLCLLRLWRSARFHLWVTHFITSPHSPTTSSSNVFTSSHSPIMQTKKAQIKALYIEKLWIANWKTTTTTVPASSWTRSNCLSKEIVLLVMDHSWFRFSFSSFPLGGYKKNNAQIPLKLEIRICIPGSQTEFACQVNSLPYCKMIVFMNRELFSNTPKHKNDCLQAVVCWKGAQIPITLCNLNQTYSWHRSRVLQNKWTLPRTTYHSTADCPKQSASKTTAMNAIHRHEFVVYFLHLEKWPLWQIGCGDKLLYQLLSLVQSNSISINDYWLRLRQKQSNTLPTFHNSIMNCELNLGISNLLPIIQIEISSCYLWWSGNWWNYCQSSSN